VTLNSLGFDVEDQLKRINECLHQIDQRLLPSTINNLINERTVLNTEREIISIFEDCDARELNYLVGHVKLALIFYKVKDHKTYSGQNRSYLINLLAVERLSSLDVYSRVIVLHSLQLMKLRANPKAENWVKNIIVNTKRDDLSIMKTMVDGKGDWFSMTKLIYNDLKSEVVRQEILDHIRREAAVQQAHMQMGTKASRKRRHLAWRKILSDVDDTLLSSGGSYPAGIDKKYAKKVVYPGVLAFYRELDLGAQTLDEWDESRDGNLVFLSARPHVYKDMSEKANFKKFEKMQALREDGRIGMHTTPSLLAGDIQSGTNYIISNDFEHLAVKKFDNFKRYVSIYPEYKHVFVADNGQGDVRAGDMMYDKYPYEFEAMYVHTVQERSKTFGYNLKEFQKKHIPFCFFNDYVEAAIHAATIAKPPLISMKGLRRVCNDARQDFVAIKPEKWATSRTKAQRRQELNQSIWRANSLLEEVGLEPVALVEAEQIWKEGERIRTPYGVGTILKFDPLHDLYEVNLDWRPLNVQLAEHLTNERNKTILPRTSNSKNDTDNNRSNGKITLETVVEIEEIEENAFMLEQGRPGRHSDKVHITASPSGHTPSSEQVRKVLDGLPSDEDRPSIEGSETASDECNGSIGIEAGHEPGEEANAPQPVAVAETGTTYQQKAASNQANFTEKLIAQKKYDTCKARATVSGCQITKYTPPLLPKLEGTRGSIFTFWSPTAKEQKKDPFNAGDHCKTPYGSATVVEYRPKQQLVVVDIVGWRARAFLREKDVELVQRGLIHKLFRKMSGHEESVAKIKDSRKSKEFPHAEGTVLSTPYGNGAVIKPLSQAVSPTWENESANEAKATADDKKTVRPHAAGPQRLQQAEPTIGVSLTSWKLADGSHPVLYCTYENAKDWKDKHDKKGFISTTVNVVSKALFIPFLGKATKPKKEEEEKEAEKEEQYFQLAAGVVTPYGVGSVADFRPKDGFYAVFLSSWTLSDGSHPIAYVKKNEMKVRIANGCQEGYPVYTKLRLTGILASVQPTTGTIIGRSLAC